jgi:putative tricarboxylic transport membrane protein
VSAPALPAPARRLRAALPYAVVLAAGAYLYYAAANFEYEEVEGRIGPGAWPKIILVLMLVPALYGFVSALLKPQAAAEPEVEQDEALIQPPEIYPGLVWAAVGATLAYLFLLPILGFFIATAIFSFALMYLGHFRRPMQATALSLIFSLVFFFLFMRVVYVALPLGTGPFADVSYALMAIMGVR